MKYEVIRIYSSGTDNSEPEVIALADVDNADAIADLLNINEEIMTDEEVEFYHLTRRRI